MLAGRGWDEDVESGVAGLPAESAHLRPPLGGVARVASWAMASRWTPDPPDQAGAAADHRPGRAAGRLGGYGAVACAGCGAGEGTSTRVTDGAAWPVRLAWLFRRSPVRGESSRGGGWPQL